MSQETITSYLCVKDSNQAIEFYKAAFGAVETSRLADPSGKICHASVQIGNSTLMMSDEFPEFNAMSPHTLGGTPVKLHLEVDDVDAVMAQAEKAGAKVLIPAADQFYGHRSGRLEDPFGHLWIVSTVIEEVSVEEMQRRFDAMCQQPNS